MNKTEHKYKVLMVHNYYQIPGGEDTVVANEKRLLEENGHEVVLYTRHNEELKNMRKVQMVCLPFTTVFNPKTYREIKKIIKEQHIEIVHVHNTLNLISPAVYYAAVKMKVPLVQTIHNFRFLCPGATFYRDGHICEDCVTKGLGCAVKHKCYRGSRAQTLICVINTWIHRHTGILGKINFICLTEFNREKLLQLKKINPEKVFVKPNFTFETPIVTCEGGVQRRHYLFIGRIEEIKGVNLIVEAFKRMKDKELLLAGDGALRQQLEKNSSTNIKFLGYVEHNKLLKLIMEAKAVILPSQTFEGFPMTILETFSMHTPIIVGDIGNNSVLVDNEMNGMKFRYNSVEDLIVTINKFESLDSEIIGEQAYRDYQNKYTAEMNYRTMKQIYDEV